MIRRLLHALVLTFLAVVLGGGTRAHAQDPVLDWQQTWDVAGPLNGPVGLLVDPAGDLVAVTTYQGQDGSGFTIGKIRGTDGTVLWRTQLNGSPGGVAKPRDAALDAAGNIYVTGIGSTRTAYLMLTAKFAPDGTLLWKKTVKNATPARLRVDPAGNAIIASTAGTQKKGFKLTTLKYSGAKGAVLWKADIALPTGEGGIRGLGIDPAGNVIMAGAMLDPNFRSLCVKYAAAKGTQLWRRDMGDTGPAAMHVLDMRVDAAGQVALVGSLDEGTGSERRCVAKLAGHDGSVLWENSSYAAAPFLHAACDPAGNLLTFGQTSSNTNHKVYANRYAAADGAGMDGALGGGYYRGGFNLCAGAVGPGGEFALLAAAGNGKVTQFRDATGRLVWEGLLLGPAGTSVAFDLSGGSLREKRIAITPRGVAIAVLHHGPDNAVGIQFAHFSAPPPGEIEVLAPDDSPWQPPSAYQLGVLPLRTTDVLPVRIRNTGKGSLLVDTFQVTDSEYVTLGPEFQLEYVSSPRLVPPGGHVDIGVIFRPKQGGYRTANLHFKSSDPDEPAFTLPLVARGMGPEQEYEDWAMAWQLAGDASLPNAAPHDDGVANLLKFAFNLDPTKSDCRPLVRDTGTAGLPIFSVESRPGHFGRWVRCEFVQRHGTGVYYLIQHSFHLQGVQGGFSTREFDARDVTVIDANWNRVVGWYEIRETEPRGFFRMLVDFTYPSR